MDVNDKKKNEEKDVYEAEKRVGKWFMFRKMQMATTTKCVEKKVVKFK